ncbi:MAG: STN domain-containing protein, partial [Bacteroidota bacterium]
MKLSCYSKNIGIWMFVLLSIWLPQRAFAADALSLEQERMLVDVLEEMGERYQVFFNYESDLLKEVTVHFEFRQTEALQDAVQRLLQNTGLKYERFGEKYIVIYRDDRQGRRTARKIEKRIDQISRLEGKGGLSISRSLNDPLQTNLNIAVQAQSLQQTISGVVRNGDGEALAGATVRG